MKVFVVMGNDFPDAVYTTETDAELHCRRKRDEEKALWAQAHPHRSANSYLARVRWYVRAFTLQGEATL